MRSFLYLTLAALLVAALPPTASAETRGNVKVLVRVTGKLNIRNHSGTPAQIKEVLVAEAERTQADLLQFLGDMKKRIPIRYKSHWIINAIELSAPAEVIRTLSDRPDVQEIVPDRIIDLPKTFPAKRRAAAGDAVWSIAIVNAPEVWKTYGLTGKGVRIGHIDTGCDGNHPDLKGKIYAWKDTIAGKPEAYDDQGHGTHSLGTIIGGSASGQAIGMAPGATVAVAKVFGATGGAETSNILTAMEWIMDPDGNPATNDAPRMVSNSWGASGVERTFWDACAAWVQAGIFPCFAAGNSGPGDKTVGTPGGFPHVFAVGATDTADKIAYFSSRGPVAWDGVSMVKPDVSAPGQDIRSSMPGGKYGEMSGTSMACPNVAGAITLLFQADPDATIDDIRRVLEETSVDLGTPGKDNTFGAGRIDVKKAVEVLTLGGKLVGTVTGTDGGPLAGATVKIAGAATLATDAAGAFRIAIKEGAYDVTVSAFGYLPVTTSVTIVRKQTANLSVALRPSPAAALTGLVIEKGTGAPLAATVSFVGVPVKPVVSDPKTGKFVATLPAGQFTAKVSCFKHKTVTVEMTIAETGANVTVEMDRLPAVLLVADSKDNYAKFYREALDGLKVGYTSQTGADDLTADTLQQYPLVIWYTGQDSASTLTGNDQAYLTAYLKSGGGLLLTGQDIGYEIKRADFYRDWLKAEYKADGAKARTVRGEAEPFAGLEFAISGGTGANNQSYPDLLAALAPAAGALSYTANGATEGVAGVAWSDKVSRVIYLGFGFEGIADAAVRLEVMKRAVAFLLPGDAALVSAPVALEERLAAGRGADRAHVLTAAERLVGRIEDELAAGRRGALDAFLAEMERKPDPQVLQLIGKSVADLLMARDPEKFEAEIARIRTLLK